MNTDSYYEIGSSHIVCEDYAIDGFFSEDVAYAIVSDGCSSSPDTDIGARIMARSLADHFRGKIQQGETWEPSFDFVISNANVVCSKMFGMQSNSLDATLVMALVSKRKGRNFAGIWISGDGGAFVQFKDGSSWFCHVVFESGAPYYQSYKLDHNRQIAYINKWPDDLKRIKTNTTLKGKDPAPREHTIGFNQEDVCMGTFDLYHENFTAEIEFISVFSDGIESYSKATDDAKKIPPEEIANRLCAYKNFKGEFVKRRMNRVKRDCVKEDISHYDDISCATIVL